MMTRALTTLGMLLFVAGSASAADGTTGVSSDNLSPDDHTYRVAVPKLIPFQGFLTDNGGNPITGGVSMDLAIYGQSVGGSALWTESRPAVAVTNGIFDVQLGSVAPISAGLFSGAERWIGISVDGEAELPRTQLVSAPHALLSDRMAGQKSGVTEIVSDTSNLQIREFYFDDNDPNMWSGESGRIIMSFNGNVEGGSGVAVVYLNGALIETINVPAAGTRPWTYQVPVSVDTNTTIDVRVRADAANAPLFVRSVDFQVDDALLGGNGLDDAYDQGGPGNGRVITADNGAVEIQGADGLVVEDDGQVQMVAFGSLGQQLLVTDEVDVPYAYVQPDADGDGGFLQVTAPSSLGFIVNGDYLGTDEPLAGVYGGTQSAIFDMSQLRDDSVRLPFSAINSSEMWNEPGIAQGRIAGDTAISSGTMTDVVTTTITIPEAGYIFVEARAQARFSGATGTATYMNMQVDEVAGGGTDGNYYYASGFTSKPAGTVWSPVTISRTYFKTAGTYTFRFEAADSDGTPGGGALWNAVITATYLPTGYGSVSTIASGGESGEFGQAERVQASGNGTSEPGTEAFRVDLRELELRAAEAQAALERARRLDAEAELQRQRDLSQQ